LIKSLTINSLDDYYNLRDLHKNNPDHHIFGEDDENQPPPQYYDSDNESITDDEKKTAIDNNTKYIEDKINTYLNQVYNCEYCNKEFTTEKSCLLHEKRCYKNNKKMKCYRCGRKGHIKYNCYASKHIKGYYL